MFSIIFICVWTFLDRFRDYLLFIAASFFVYAIAATSQILEVPRNVGLNTMLTAVLYIGSAMLMARGMVARYGVRLSNSRLIAGGLALSAAMAYYFYITPDVISRIYILNLGSSAILLFPVLHWWKRLGNRVIDRLLFWVYVAFAISFFPRTFYSISLSVTGSIAELIQSPFWLTLQLALLLFAMVLALVILAAAIVDTIESLQNERNIDGLTQLHNRRSFEEQGTSIIGDSRRRDVSLVLCDIDYFKSINDKDGHAAGDQVLQAFGEIVRDCIRVEDIAARVGGEEFALLLPNTPLDGAVQLAERVRNHLAKTPFRTLAGERIVTASFGVTQRTGNETLQAFFARADAMLYTAKSNGRNSVAVGSFSPA